MVYYEKIDHASRNGVSIMLSKQPTQEMVAAALYFATQAGLQTLQQGVRPYMALRLMGGDAQPQIHVQLLSAMIDLKSKVQQVISAPRWHIHDPRSDGLAPGW